MPSLFEIRQMIVASDPAQWHKPLTGPYFTDAYDVDDDVFRFHGELYVFEPDVDLTIQEGLKWGHLADSVNKATDLWDDAHFPDPSARVTWADVFWRGSLIDRVNVVSVDGARATLPVGTRTPKDPEAARRLTPGVKVEWDYSATAFETAVARVVDGGYDFDDYFRRAGLRVLG
jgi:hypothetical protein